MGNIHITLMILVFSILSIPAQAGSMTCKNTRQSYPVIYNITKRTFVLPGVDNGDPVYYNVEYAYPTQIHGTVNNGSLKFTAYLKGNKRIEFYKLDGDFLQEDSCR